VKKKLVVSSKDKKDWDDFTKQMGDISTKAADLDKGKISINKIKKLDLHGCSLDQANKKVKKFILESYDDGFQKLIIITGKGLRSKSYDNPYVSEKLSVLKYSIPEYIQNNENLNSKIFKITEADIQEGGQGAIYIFLKNKKNL
tara:strand:- start:2153 stop:2584 length:432 start_codon:yes stop_codon:yes gene_type:complete